MPKKPVVKKQTKVKAANPALGRKAAKSAAGVRSENSAPAPAAGSASERFVNDLLVRGEAVPETPGQRLPLGATHKITKQNEDGSVEVKRVRFKLF